jgi:intron-binding protein aquarius
VLEVRDASGKVINDPGHPGALRDGRPPQGTVRTITLALDPAQYQRDVEERAAAAAKRQARDKRRAARERRRRLLMMGAEDEEDQEDEDDDATDPFLEEDVYASFNVVARREGKENNFAALLDALRDGLSAGGGGGGGGASASAAGGEGCVPLWLRDVLLGYGDPAAAHYTRLPGAPMGPRAPADLVPPGPGEEEEKERGDGAAAAAARAEAEAAMASAAGPYARCIDFRDTFLDAEHAAASFPQYRVKFLPPIVVDTSATHGALHGHVVGGAASAAWGSGVGGGGLGASSSSSSPLLHPDLAAAAREDDADAHLARALDELDSSSLPRPPYRATFPPRGADRGRDASCPGATRAGVAGRRAALGGGEDEANQPPPILLLRPYSPPNPGPYPSDSPQPNTVRFTPTQVEAVRAGVQPGLTLVVGPPGTGKTDTCAQVLSVLYRSEPGRRVLLCTHSNAALNDLFAKLAARAVPERHLLRLGAGERDLDVEGDFSRRGRVDAALARRLALLAEVARVARAMGSEAVADPEAAAATCESAGNFWLTHVLARWERFLAEVKAAKRASKEQGEGGAASAAAAAAAASANGLVARLFPFSAVFADAPGPHPLLRGEDDDADMEVAKGCFRHLARVFGELSELRAFELLRGSGDRAAYLATVQARVVAMTVTHAALKRREFLDLALQFDSLVMEEAGQVLDCESFLPMCLLQRAAGGGGGGAGDGAATQQHRLRRVVLVGDHHQLPPVVQNAALAKGAGLDQPLFTRLVRLGVPHVLLDAQGRCRPSIAALFAWRYRGAGASSSALRLRDLPCVVPRDLGEDSAGVAESRGFSPYDYANPGLAFDFQLIDPNDGAGAGAGAGGAAAGAAGGPQQPLLSQESAPRPHFWQNLPEAEYAVALYQFMRLLGYPADRIALLTTYNGQAALLRDIVERRCCGAGGGGASSLFGRPGCISTVDKYQGRQSDYVILSLVRTRRVGHLRDVRRLVVALSRARLGLYVFGSASLFASCPELRPAFEKGLLTRPLRLALVRGEAFSSLEAAQAAGGGRVAGLRAAGDPVPPPTEQGGATHFVSGLAEMGALVAQVAMERQQQQQQQQQQQAVAVAAAADQVMAAVEAEVTGGGGGGAMEDD